MSKPQTCSICQDPIEVNWMGWADGNNAMPVNDGRCCDRCNDSIVLHARIELAEEFWTDAWPLGKLTDEWPLGKITDTYPKAEGFSGGSG